MIPTVCDVDDLWNEDQLALLVERKSANERFLVTAYAIPNKLGPVHALSKAFPWVTFAVHGWEHGQFECLGWTQADAERWVGKALEMGYAPLFKAPNWQMDEEIEKALVTLGVAAHVHVEYIPKVPGLRYYRGGLTGPDHYWLHTHLTRNPSTDDIFNHVGFHMKNVAKVPTWSTPLDHLETVTAPPEAA